MSLYLKPHSVRVYMPEETVAAGTKVVTASGFSAEPSIVPCKMEPLTPGTVFEQTGIETKRPYRLMCELADSETFRDNARVVWVLTGFVFRVKSKKRNEAFADTSHCEVMLDIEGDEER